MPTRLEAKRLRASHAGDEAEMVVGDALRVAALGPPAELAVGDRVRVGVARRGGDLGEEALLDPAVVGVELRERGSCAARACRG